MSQTAPSELTGIHSKTPWASPIITALIIYLQSLLTRCMYIRIILKNIVYSKKPLAIGYIFLNLTSTRVPTPNSLLIETSPFKYPTICFTIASPNPVPISDRDLSTL